MENASLIKQSLKRVAKLCVYVIVPAVFAYWLMTGIESKRADYEKTREAAVMYVTSTAQKGNGCTKPSDPVSTVTKNGPRPEMIEWDIDLLNCQMQRQPDPAAGTGQSLSANSETRVKNYLREIELIPFKNADEIVNALNEKVRANQEARDAKSVREEQMARRRVESLRSIVDSKFNQEITVADPTKFDALTAKQKMLKSFQEAIRTRPELSWQDAAQLFGQEPAQKDFIKLNELGAVDGALAVPAGTVKRYQIYVDIDQVVNGAKGIFEAKLNQEHLQNNDDAKKDLEYIRTQLRQPIANTVNIQRNRMLAYQDAFLLRIFNNKSGSGVIFQVLWLICIALVVFALLYLILLGVKALPQFADGTGELSKQAYSFLQPRDSSGGPPLAKALLVTASAVGIGSVVIGGAALSNRPPTIDQGESSYETSSHRAGGLGGSNQDPSNRRVRSEIEPDPQIQFVPQPYPSPLSVVAEVKGSDLPIVATVDVSTLNELKNSIGSISKATQEGFEKFNGVSRSINNLNAQYARSLSWLDQINENARFLNSSVNPPGSLPPRSAPDPFNFFAPTPGIAVTRVPAAFQIPPLSTTPQTNPRQQADDGNLYSLVRTINQRIQSVDSRVKTTEGQLPSLTPETRSNRLWNRVRSLFESDRFQVTALSYSFLAKQMCPSMAQDTETCTEDPPVNALLVILKKLVSQPPVNEGPFERLFKDTSRHELAGWSTWKDLIKSRTRIAR